MLSNTNYSPFSRSADYLKLRKTYIAERWFTLYVLKEKIR